MIDDMRPTAPPAHALKPAVRWATGHALPRAVMHVVARRGDLQGRLITGSDDSRQVGEILDTLRERGPMVSTRIGHITVSHADCKQVLSSPDFRSGIPVPETGPVGRLYQWSLSEGLHPMQAPSLLVTEPPQHTRYRKLVTGVFTHRAVEALRDQIQVIADDLLDEIEREADHPIDIVERYCSLMPVTVISQILGVPEEDRPRVLAYGSAAAPSLDLGLTWREFRSVEGALADFDEWLGMHLGRLRRDPGENLLSKLVAAADEGEGLTELELKSTAGLVLAAGFETTVNLLGNGIALLATAPDQLDALRADPSLWPNAVDEILRIDPPVLLTGRVAVRDTEVGGRHIAEGGVVTTVLAGANRDPEVFADPDVFDVRRANARDHLAFGYGRHHCLGAALARIEGEVGLRSVFERYPDLRLLPGAARRSTRILRGYERLPVQLR